MYCGKCGAKIIDGGKFCPKCGESHNFVENIEVDRSENVISTNQLNNNSNRSINSNTDSNSDSSRFNNTPVVKSSNKTLYAVCAITILVVIAGVIFFIMQNRKDDDKDNKSKNYATESDAKSEKSNNEDEQITTDEKKQEETEESQPKTEAVANETDDKNNEDLTTEDETQDNQEDLVKQDSVSVEYLDSAPNITGTIKKIPIYNASASSMLEEELNNEQYFNYPFYMFDEDDKTSWQEGVDGIGSGESAGVYLEGVYQVNYICFKLGNWTSEKWYNKNPRPKSLTLDIDGELIDLSFPDGMEERWVKIENAPKSSYLHVYLGDVYPGTEYEDTCINEIVLYGTWYENVEY